MHFTFLALAAAGLLMLVQTTAAETQFKYPAAPTSNQVDDYDGVKVADPYRLLENPDSPESRAWIEAENKITFDFLKTIPERDEIKKRLTQVWDYERFGVPFKEDGHYFFSRTPVCKTRMCSIPRPIFLRRRANYSILICWRRLGRSRWADLM